MSMVSHPLSLGTYADWVAFHQNIGRKSGASWQPATPHWVADVVALASESEAPRNPITSMTKMSQTGAPRHSFGFSCAA